MIKANATLEKVTKMKKVHFSALIYIFGVVFLAAVAYGGNDKDILTPHERLWLNQNQSRIVYAVEANYAPFVFIGSNGEATGLAYDYMRLVESNLGVHFKEKRFSSLDDIFSNVRSHEVQIVNAVTATPKRSEFLSFTDFFISVPNVIVVNKKRYHWMQEKDLSGLSVSLVKSYAVTEYLINKGLGITPDLVSSDLEALLNVSFGKSDAAVIDLATASYLISKNGITNLRVAGKTDFNIKLSMATSIDKPELRNIIQKALSTITDAQHKEIHNRWINASTQSIFYDWRFWAIVGVALLISLAIVIWNRVLHYQINLRIKAEQELKILNAELTKNSHELNAIYESLNKAQTLAHIGNWTWDIQANTLWWSDEIYRIFGLHPQEFKANYEAFLLQVHPDDREKVQEAVNHALANKVNYSIAQYRSKRWNHTPCYRRCRGDV